MDRFGELQEKIVLLLRPYARRIAICGSFARGDEADDSGIDSGIEILIDLLPPGERPPLGLKWFRLEEELSRILGREVELVSERAMSPFVRPYVEKDMVLLYEEG
ncbi:nucleotidyltransferase family protein [Methanothrix harundinacea]|uniref:DNA polymerase, beta domain protein region n=1 Tax=Methanothrix harundinacea (strain 6Ac) TaxID=1110509 RepID=G7WQ25_METH6|nr:DNA polymerase beta domain-containing protein region [Methanothrix harundinacea]AET65056.1 DNA polymerase, beta domain protein region [Methanothrix harundinacea 6Ac]